MKVIHKKACSYLWLAGTLGIFAFLIGVSSANATVPVWVVQFNSCTQFQITHELFQTDLHTFLTQEKQKAERRAQLRDIIKAREDVNKLVATVYNELRTQQIAFSDNTVPPDVRNVLLSVGIAVDDHNTDEICKASYYIKAKVGSEGDQCVAVAQEARLITNQDDYIYEEGRRQAMDALFCYLGDWRHFPISRINDPGNCEQLGIGIINEGGHTSGCTVPQVWEKLGTLLFHDPNHYSDMDGTKTPDVINDDQHIHNLCEGMRALGKKCSQDMLRDYIKYSTIDKITRKDRTIILAPPQTWYTPDRCKIIEASIPIQSDKPLNQGKDTPYTKNIKSLDLQKPDVNNSSEFLDYYFGSRLGNPTIRKTPADMSASEYTIPKELQAISIPENSFSGLAAKTEQIASQIISEVTDLRKLQYTAGEGLRDTTLRIGWKDYEWNANSFYLGKYAALDLPVVDPKKPNKIFKPLPCYWEAAGSPGIRCESLGLGTVVNPRAAPTGKTFYFDTGIVIAPISITKDKLRSAIQAQFDLAQKAFNDTDEKTITTPKLGQCAAIGKLKFGIDTILPAPWEDVKVNLATAINPLTGEPYTFGTPGKANPPFRIPGINNNYFNFFYNDIFQLYHTSFPDVLAGWFRLNTPAYDSIYGPLKEPIQFSSNGDPGSGPPGGGGPGGGSGRGGSGGGKCEPITDPTNPCAVQNLQDTCFGANAEKASIICNVESGGNPLLPSGADICQPSGPPVSWGLFQINISANDLNGLNCAPPPHPAAFDRAYTGSNHQCQIEDEGLFAQCRAAATDANINIQKACELSANGTNWGRWANTARKCGI